MSTTCPWGLRRNLAPHKIRQIPGMPHNVFGNRWALRRVNIQVTHVFRKRERQMADAAGRRHLLKRGQRRAQCRSLTGVVARQTDGEPERILNRSDPWHTHSRSQIRNIRHRDGAEAGCLDLSLNQSHGPAANRSYRHKDHYIHAFCAQPANDGRDTLVDQSFRLTRVTDKGIM